jgi:hypothetical protein
MPAVKNSKTAADSKKKAPAKAVKKQPKAALGKFKIGQKIFLVSRESDPAQVIPIVFEGYRPSAGWGNYGNGKYAHLADMYATKAEAERAANPTLEEIIHSLENTREALILRLEAIDQRIDHLRNQNSK